MKAALWGILIWLCMSVGIAEAQTVPDPSEFLNLNTILNAVPAAPASQVDLLFDTDSYVPPLYQGRPLPSPGTHVFFQAVAHFTAADGSTIPSSQITYTWKRNGRVEGAVSGLGRSSVSLSAPTLFGADTIFVEASAGSGLYGSASLTIPAIDPGITLYQDHPLFGIEYYNALGSASTIADLEATFAGVPYFAAAQTPGDTALSWNWTVNDTPVSSSASNASELTIDANKSSGIASIDLTVTSPRNPLLLAHNAWNITFSHVSGTPTSRSQ